MLATFVIGLREGLEAALIVGIIAAFLRNNGRSLTAMWLGVVLALVLSVAVGVALKLVEQALPQAQQEALETVIGAVAVVFVTGMILWMNRHARDMKRQIESEAAQALGQASAFALALMAFLAVLKEGFETSVFLLATFSVAQSAASAAIGAVLGLLLSAVLGWGIYIGGVRINLSRFFRVTGAFLILVAAGLVISALRTAHEAGWINAGQQATVNLDWLVAPGTVQSALVTGVLGIPSDPRLIEVIGWFAYLVPVTLLIYWPASRRPGPRGASRLRLAIAGGLAATALGLAVLYPTPHPQIPERAPIIATDGSGQPVGTARLTADADGTRALTISLDGSAPTTLVLPTESARSVRHSGMITSAWTIAETGAPADAPANLTLQDVVDLAGGRIPVGIDRQRNPGPFNADWSTRREISAWTADDVLLDASQATTAVVTLSGGGLGSPRTLTVRDEAGGAAGWAVTDAYREQATDALHRLSGARAERQLWAVQLPIVLGVIALLLVLSAARDLMRLRRTADTTTTTTTSGAGQPADDSIQEGAPNAAH